MLGAAPPISDRDAAMITMWLTAVRQRSHTDQKNRIRWVFSRLLAIRAGARIGGFPFLGRVIGPVGSQLKLVRFLTRDLNFV